MGLDTDQRIEMLTKIRELRGTGQPEVAADIQVALDRDEYFLGGRKQPVEILDMPKKSAKREAWERYAKEVSDIDHEIIEGLLRDDLIAMLRANGLIEDL